MPAPDIMSSADWLRRTAVAKKVGTGDKARSAALQYVDNLVAAYEGQRSVSNLTFLENFLNAWMQSKTKYFGPFKKIRDSMRDYDGAVTELKRSVDHATQLWSPLPSAYAGIFIGADTYRGNDWVPDGFVGTVRQCIAAIAGKPIGAKLLQDLSDGCTRDPVKKVVIEYGARSTAAPIPVVTNESRKKVQPCLGEDRYDLDALMSDPALLAVARDGDGDIPDYVGGAGTGAVVTFKHTDPGPPGAPRPAFIALAHELIHALHYVQGMCYRAATGGIQDGGNTGLMEEEMRTVGLHQYAGEIPSENAIRAEQTPPIPRRTDYSATDSFANVTATPFG